jgi:hypothetical protein
MGGKGLVLAAIGLSCVHGDGMANVLATLLKGEKAPLRRVGGFFNSSFENQITALPGTREPGAQADRLPELLSIALNDLLGNAAAVWPRAHAVLPCALLLAEAGRPGAVPPALRTRLVELVRSKINTATGLDLDITVFQDSEVGLGTWAEQALPRNEPCILVAVDSCVTREALRELDDHGLLFSRRNPYGVVPGEAATAILLLPTDKDDGFRITRAAVTLEPVREFEERDTDFAAMTEAVAACFSAPPDLWLSDLNNSRYRAAQLAHAVLRKGGQAPVMALPLKFGYCGAVSGTLGLVCAHAVEGATSSVLISMSNLSGKCCVIRVEKEADPLLYEG